MAENFVIGAPDWLIPAVCVGSLLVLLVVYVYFRIPLPTPVRSLAIAAKIVALVCIAVCLVDPLWSGKRPRPQANVVALLVDNSQSMLMQIPDEPMSRGQQMRTLLSKSAGWRKRLEQDFDVRGYAFDSRIRGTNEFDALDFSGTSSAMLAGLTTVHERFSHRPTAGILLFSDGNATDIVDSSVDWNSIKVPVYPVVPRPRNELRDLRISHVVTSQSDFETTPVTVDVQIAAQGMTGTPVTVQLLDKHNAVVGQESLQAPADDLSSTVHFRFRPQEIGTQFYRVTAVATDKQDDFQNARSIGEATERNNETWTAVQRRRGPYRVLYVSGRPNWEFKFLRRAIQEDTEVTLIGLIRIAKESPKFAFRDRDVSSANPLFEGFSADDEESAEQRDEPVLLRVGVDSQDELRTGFPLDDAGLFRYDAVVLDDIEAKFFTQDQLLLLRRFVSERGGGLLLLGGADAFDRAGYETTPLAELAPVYAVRDQAAKPTSPVQLSFTREGWLQPWMRLRATEVSERDRLAGMPRFITWNMVERTKPGATVLSYLNDPDQEDTAKGERPGLVVQRFGTGRCAVLLVGDLWRWGMHRKPDEQRDLAQAWRQMVRWLTSDVPRRVEVAATTVDSPDEPVQVQVTVRDADYQPLDNANIALSVVTPDGNSTPLATTPSESVAGLYTASYWARQTGGYRVIATANGPDGSEIGTSEAGWVSAPAAAEYRQLATNYQQLTELARQTGGEVIEHDDLDRFVTDLPRRAVPVTEHWVYPLWHHPWVLGLAALSLCAEWGLRRWKGLP